MRRGLRALFAMLFCLSSLPFLAAAPVSAVAPPEPIAIMINQDGFSAANSGGDAASTLLWMKGGASFASGALRLVDNIDSTPSSGSVVRRAQILLSDGFSTYFMIRMSDYVYYYGDGLAFVLYSAAQPQLGTSGSGLGYDGIRQSVAVEFDTYINGGIGDPAGNGHAAIMLNGYSTHNDQPAGSLGNSVGITGTDIHAWVDYENGIVTVTYGPDSVRSGAGNATITRNVGTFLEGQDIFVGFSAAKGGARANHDLRKWYFKDSSVAGGLSSTGNYTQGAGSIGITLDRSENPDGYTVQVRDAGGALMTSQGVTMYLDGQETGTVNTGSEGTYAGVISGLTARTHVLRAVAQNGGTAASVSFAVTSVSCTVEHWLQTADGSGYTLQASQPLSAPHGSTVTAAPGVYEGWTEDEGNALRIPSGTVRAGETAPVLRLYYNRNIHPYVYEDSYGQVLTSGSAAFGGTVPAAGDPVRADARFAGWFREASWTTRWDAATDRMPDAPLRLYAKWIFTPASPALDARSAVSITLRDSGVPGLEYRMDDGIWQASRVFSGLSSDTEYHFETRIAAAGADPASLASAPAVFRTDKVRLTAGSVDASVSALGDISFDPDTELVVERITGGLTDADRAAHTVHLALQRDGQGIAELYDIRLLLDGQPIQPGGTIRIRISLPAGLLAYAEQLKILYIADDGSTAVIPHSIDGGFIVFETDHLSAYAVVAPLEAIPALGESARTAGLAVLTAAAALAMIRQVLRIRRRRQGAPTN
ncbi:MAG: InlB B-repeat-containing protein [Clostridia bacterium]|nr:InlB B-repeat-containing protein [Clostridia bacterium]